MATSLKVLGQGHCLHLISFALVLYLCSSADGQQGERKLQPRAVVQQAWAASKADSSSFEEVSSASIERRILKEKKEKKENKAHYLAMIQYGCSGSSALVHLTRELLRAHGFLTLEGKSEIIKPEKNKFYESAKQTLAPNGEKVSKTKVVREMMHQTLQHVEDSDMTAIFKLGPRKTAIAFGENGLLELGVKFIHFYRSNLLDHVLCEVRDCQLRGKRVGYPVFPANGTRTDICFGRRRTHVKVKAYLNVSATVAYMKHWDERMAGEQASLPYDRLETGERYSAEDLYGFEYTQDEDMFDRSRSEWMRLLSRVIDSPDETTVNDFLRKYQGTRTPHPHYDIIYNYAETVAALKEAQLDHYLIEKGVEIPRRPKRLIGM